LLRIRPEHSLGNHDSSIPVAGGTQRAKSSISLVPDKGPLYEGGLTMRGTSDIRPISTRRVRAKKKKKLAEMNTKKYKGGVM